MVGASLNIENVDWKRVSYKKQLIKFKYILSKQNIFFMFQMTLNF